MQFWQSEQILERLATLSDLDYHVRAWIDGVENDVTSPTEILCQLFDDTSLGDLLEKHQPVFSEDIDKILLKIENYTYKLQDRMDDRTLIYSSAWKELSAAAGEAATLIRSSGAVDPVYAIVDVIIARVVNQSFPAWVECELTDVNGKIHVFRDKSPIFESNSPRRDTKLPRSGGIRCRVVGEESGRMMVDTELPDHIESISGFTRFSVLPSQFSQD